MIWQISFTASADNDFAKLEKVDKRKIIKYLRENVQWDCLARSETMKI